MLIVASKWTLWESIIACPHRGAAVPREPAEKPA
jgi:hypothetical protein